MSIRLHCPQCGHSIELDDRFRGKHGTCKHCGQPITVPDHTEAAPEPPLRLREIDTEEPPRVPGHLLRPPSELKVRPASDDPVLRPKAISEPDLPPHRRHHGAEEYVVGRDGEPREGSSGPPSFLEILPVRTARLVSRILWTLRDWLYLISLTALVVVLLGYLFQWKILLHLGAVVVVAANISMLCVGLAYLISLPFKEGLRYGLANLLVPFYAIYYWVTRWPRMKRPVLNTVRSFTPIGLVALAYLIYEEAPVVESVIEKEIPALEKTLDEKLPAIDKQLPSLNVEKALEPSATTPAESEKPTPAPKGPPPF
jgi:hypothetical protein